MREGGRINKSEAEIARMRNRGRMRNGGRTNKSDSENEKGCEDKNEDSKLLKKININSDEIIKQ